MKKLQQNFFFVTAVVVITAGAASTARAQEANTNPQVWVAPAAQKVRPQLQPDAQSATSATLAAAQNEFESFQVVVTGPAQGVSMTLLQLDDGQGHVISGRDVVLYREALIDVAQQSGGDGATGQWPDALIPDVDPIAGEKRNAFPFDAAAGQSTAVLVDVHVPAGAPAGSYHGQVVVSAAGQGSPLAQVPVTLTVWDFAIPSTSSLRSSFGLSWNGPCVGHHGDLKCLNTAAEAALRARYVQAALDNRISIDRPSMNIPINLDGSGDFSTFDADAAPFLNGTANTRLAGARLTSVQMASPGVPTAAVAAAWGSHFTAAGWHGALYDYACDEPPATCAWSDINHRIGQVKQGDPQLPTLVTTSAQRGQQNGATMVDIFAPVLNWMEDKPDGTYPGPQRGNYGATVWWYQSCMSFGCAGVGAPYVAGSASYETGWPTMAIDADGTRNRAMEWLSFAYGVGGELYYETTMAYFTGDAWTHQYNFGGNGDGTLFYPGTIDRIGGQTEIPVESLRMKMIRDGMEDYELLALAQKLGMGDQALQIARGVYPRTFQAVSTPAALDAARAELAGLILHALGRDKTSPGSGAVGAPAGTSTKADSAGAKSRDVWSAFPNGGCATGGTDFAFLGLPLLALFFNRRKSIYKESRKPGKGTSE